MKEKIKLVAFDCDGVLTDNKLLYADKIYRGRFFNTSDAIACLVLKSLDIKTVLLTSAVEQSLSVRSRHMKITDCIRGSKRKLDDLIEICIFYGVDIKTEVVYIGNDIIDLPVLEIVKWAYCPLDAEPEVKELEGIHVLTKKGGEGVLREFVRLLKKEKK